MKKKLILLILCLLSFSGCNEARKQEKIELHKKNEEIKNASPVEATQKKLLEEHNKQRKTKEIKELILSNELCDYAQKHANEMANKNSLYHSQISNIKAEWVGENIAWGQETEISVVDSWMWSPMHRSNILNSRYKKVGFGKAKDGNGRIYWCAVFTN